MASAGLPLTPPPPRGTGRGLPRRRAARTGTRAARRRGETNLWPDGQGDGPTPPPEHPESSPTPTDSLTPSTPSPTPNGRQYHAVADAARHLRAAKQPIPPPTPVPQSQTPEDDGADGRAQRLPVWLWIVLGILLLLALIALAVLWLRARLRKTDPTVLAARAKTREEAGLILCRAMLTLLARTGQAPLGGEELPAFAHRACVGALSNPDFEEFCGQLALSRYARAPLAAEDLETGVRAYRRMRKAVRRGDRWRFDLQRALHGLGDIASIP